jgi:hypothetical protein
MYIPTIFLGSNGACITANGGATGSFVSGSNVYKYHLFTSAGTSSLNIINGGTRQANVYIIGGGGGGAKSTYDGAGGGYGAGGGGGAGGVVRYTQFPIQSGSYEIVVGQTGSAGFATNGNAGVIGTGYNGSDSWIKLPTGTWPPFTNQYITAYGGGGGGWAYPAVTGPVVAPGVGASAGGNAQKYSGAAINSGSNSGDGYGGLNGLNQGNKSGAIPTSIGSGNTNNANTSTGGGGAGTASPNRITNSATKATNGGDGIQISITGSPVFYVAGGGAGNAQHTIGSAGIGQNSYGGGGTAGDTRGGGSGATYDAQPGNTGMVYLEYPLCITDLTNCTTYRAASGVSVGATITYVPCGGGALISASILQNTTQSFCTYPSSGYPTISGAGSSLTVIGSCTVNLPFTGSTICPSGSFISSSYTYTFTNSTATTPNPGGPSIRVTGYCNYYDNDGIYQEFYNYYWQPLTRTFCARPTPAPYAANGTISQGGVCAQYCTGVSASCYNWSYQWTTSNNDEVTYQDCTGSIVQFSRSQTPGSGSFCAQGTPFSTLGFVAFTKNGLC